MKIENPYFFEDCSIAAIKRKNQDILIEIDASSDDFPERKFIVTMYEVKHILQDGKEEHEFGMIAEEGEIFYFENESSSKLNLVVEWQNYPRKPSVIFPVIEYEFKFKSILVQEIKEK